MKSWNLRHRRWNWRLILGPALAAGSTDESSIAQGFAVPVTGQRTFHQAPPFLYQCSCYGIDTVPSLQGSSGGGIDDWWTAWRDVVSDDLPCPPALCTTNILVRRKLGTSIVRNSKLNPICEWKNSMTPQCPTETPSNIVPLNEQS